MGAAQGLAVSPSVSCATERVQATKHSWKALEVRRAITQPRQSGEGMPFSKGRNRRSQTNFASPNSAIVFQPSAPLTTAQMHSRRISSSGYSCLLYTSDAADE